MSRDTILGLIDVAHGRGLEIGALDKPMLTRAQGPVEYVDRASREELLRWYAGDAGVNLAAVVEVDHVWGEQTLLEAVGGRRVFDYLVASHVIEHVPDLFGWLREIAEVLVDGGIAGFAVPDRRYTFDVKRRVSGGAEMVDAYVRRLRRPDPRQIFDNFHYFSDPATGFNRDGVEPTDARVTQSARVLLEFCERVHGAGEYVDAHCWVFTPRSLLEALDLASRMGLLPYEIAALDPTAPGTIEFMLALRRLPDGLSLDAQRAAFVASAVGVDLPEELTSAEQWDRELLAEGRHAIARLAAIEASTSWRLTAPLRAVVTMLQRLAGRAGA